MRMVNWVPNHRPEHCAGQFCTMHNPSDHSMRDWDLHWRSDRAVFERVCPHHGTGHPDPDCINHLIRSKGAEGYTEAIHGCCGCWECEEAFRPGSNKGKKRKEKSE